MQPAALHVDHGRAKLDVDVAQVGGISVKAARRACVQGVALRRPREEVAVPCELRGLSAALSAGRIEVQGLPFIDRDPAVLELECVAVVVQPGAGEYITADPDGSFVHLKVECAELGQQLLVVGVEYWRRRRRHAGCPR